MIGLFGANLTTGEDADEVSDEIGDIFLAADKEEELQVLLMDEVVKGLLELLACLGVEADEGVVDDQESGMGLQGLIELIFTELATGEADDIFAIHHGR